MYGANVFMTYDGFLLIFSPGRVRILSHGGQDTLPTVKKKHERNFCICQISKDSCPDR